MLVLIVWVVASIFVVTNLREDLKAANSEMQTLRTEHAFVRESLLDALQDATSKEKEADAYAAAIVSNYRNVDPELAGIISSEAVRQGTLRGIHPAIILSIIKTESGFDPFATSKAGAVGLMQVMPSVHRDKINAADNLFSIRTNIKIGSTILAKYIKDSDDEIADALHRYLSRRAKGKKLSEYQLKVLTAFWEISTSYETLRQAKNNN